MRNRLGQFVKGHKPYNNIFKKGEKHRDWRGGRGKYWARTVARQAGLYKNGCFGCGSKIDLDVHHIDGNQNNNDIENLHVYCRKCHSKQHINVMGRKRAGKIIKCEWCGNEIYRCLSKIKRSKHHFCDHFCQGKWRAKYGVGLFAKK